MKKNLSRLRGRNVRGKPTILSRTRWFALNAFFEIIVQRPGYSHVSVYSLIFLTDDEGTK